MKCEELQYERLGDANKTYPASTLVIRKQFVDAAIAELKNEITRKEGVEKRWFDGCMEARAENVRLKRALWLARANRAHAEWAHWAAIWFCNPNAILNINKSSVSQNPDRYTIQRGAVIWRNMWEEVESKCRAKAEEYE